MNVRDQRGGSFLIRPTKKCPIMTYHHQPSPPKPFLDSRDFLYFPRASLFQQLCGVVTGADVLVATPWYLLDMVESSTFSCEDIKYLVLDVAEKILDIRFEPMISKRVDGIGMLQKSVRRTMDFIATFPPEIQLPDLERSGGILVSTPGRLMEIDGRLEVPVEAIDCLVLDEADKMPDMSFEPQKKKKSIERSRTRLQPSIARAYFFSLVLLLLFVGGSSAPVLENEFTMEFCPLNTSETFPVPQFKRPLRTHNTQLAEQLLQMQSERRMLANQEQKCNDSQRLDVQIVSKAGSIISFVAKFGPVISMVGIEELDESQKILLASSSMFISASNIFWAWYQQMQECPSLFIIIILSLAAFLHALYSVLFWVHTDLNMTWLLSGFTVIIAAGLVVNLSVSTASILALISVFTGHVARVAAIRRHRIAAAILAICDLCAFSAFYGGNWKDQTLFKISCFISSGSRIAELLVHLYFYGIAPEDAPGIGAVAHDGAVIPNASADAPGVGDGGPPVIAAIDQDGADRGVQI